MDRSDPAALAASTAQGWAHALNTMARPAPEHLEAAQEALTTLERADRPIQSWIGVKHTLKEALETARLRVDGGRPLGDITIAELRGALDELAELGLGARPVQLDSEDPDWPRPPAGYAQAYVAARRLQEEAEARAAELEEELEEANEQAALQEAELRRQVELRDRFEQERVSADARTKAAHAGHSAAIAAAREDSRRAGYRWMLAQLGMNAPGFDQMGADELREEATTVLGRTLAEAQRLRLVAKELGRAARVLGLGYDGAPYVLPGPDQPTELATLVVQLATWSQRARRAALERQTELEDQLAEQRPDMDLAAVRAERDMLTKARDAQAAELRALREELAAAEKRRAELETSLEALRRHHADHHRDQP